MEDDQANVSHGKEKQASVELPLHWSEWQLLDSILPTGGFAHSFGLEAAIQARLISSPDDLRTYVIHILENTGSLLLPFVCTATMSPDLETWHKLDRMLDATLTNEVSRKASTAQGSALLRVAASVFTEVPSLKKMREISLNFGDVAFHHAPLFGIICGLLGLHRGTSQRAYMFITLRDIISAATRLNLVGPLGAAVLQHQIAFVAEAMLKKWKDRAVEEACQTSPLLDTVMSLLRSFKESLKPCSNFPLNFSQSSSVSQELSNDTLIIPRRPPKSSLAQQLQRLGETYNFSLPQQNPETRREKAPVEKSNDFDDEEEEKEQEQEKFGRHQLSQFQFDHTGPFEPLVLSKDGEFPIIQVPASINYRLLEHQREGVKFLYKLYKNKCGGILGDDMGLGKTIQTIAFLAAVFGKDESSDSTILNDNKVDKKGYVLIICPSSVIQNWEIEFSRWSTFNVSIYHGPNRDMILEKLEACGVEVLITSFDSYRIHGSILSEVNWEIVIVDEAHRLKNEKSKLYMACLEIKTRNRIGLTGTIMQNKIMELYNLFDWVAPGSLGTREHFREFYDEPLKHGQRSTAPERFIRIADERKQHLVAVLRKYLLRRTKEETIGHLMMGKEDNVVFCTMSDLQKRAYRRLLQLPEIRCLINKDLPCSCGSPLTQVECCKRIVPDGIIWRYLHRDNLDGCDSCPFCLVLPCLVKLQQISNHLELIKPNPRDEPDKQRKDAELASAVFGPDIDLVGGNAQNDSFIGLSDVKSCGKMQALEKLMYSWASKGDKILLFSYSVRMLDILEKFLIRKGYSFSRLDGSTPSNLRQSLVDDFNSSPSKLVFLISTRAGGLGLNLVSANRVVIFDPNWNPAQDLQAQDRSFRFGQKRHVIVFRLLSAGSLEELVYTRQVYKQQLSNIAVSGKLEKRYFEGVQDCKEFQGELFGICNLFRDLSDKLFTSEIIESHEEQGQQHERHHCTNQGFKGLETHTVSSKDANTLLSTGSKTRKSSDPEMARTSKPLLEDMGIVYAHRNDDIVNKQPGFQRKKEESFPQDLRSQPLQIPSKRRNLLDCADGKESLASSKDRKNIEYSLLARFMGMDVFEFSKWILSATPSAREKLLQDYRKRKKIPKG